MTVGVLRHGSHRLGVVIKFKTCNRPDSALAVENVEPVLGHKNPKAIRPKVSASTSNLSDSTDQSHWQKGLRISLPSAGPRRSSTLLRSPGAW
jgi:hypothetical protein